MLLSATLCAVASEAKTERLFNAKEVNADAFGVLSMPDFTGPAKWGEGVGVSYFVTRGLGFGARAIAYNNGGTFIDETEARVLFRVPLWDRVAPYGYASGLYSFERKCAGAGAGFGLEYRFTKNIAAFIESGLRVGVGCDDITSVTYGECNVKTVTTTDVPSCDWLSTAGLRIAF